MGTDRQATVGILADDLTSAADGAAPFVMRGMPASIGRGRLPRQGGSVVAVDSGARSVSAPEAAARVAALTARLAAQDILYKTVDSTLRGHVTVELAACFRASGREKLVFAPAFPAAGRTTVAGVQLVDGIPVAETVYGRDPVHPARHSALADLVPDSISRVVMLDATTQAELDAKVAAQPDPESILWVGSPGMASALARRLASVPGPAAAMGAAAGEILVVIGTANRRSHGQAEALRGIAGVTVLRSPAEPHDDPAAVLRRIADDAATRIRSGSVTAVVATGGDTMEAIMQRLDIGEFEVLRELEPGFPLGSAVVRAGPPLLVAMKAGGFGDDGTLLRAVAQLRQTAASEPRPSP
jgi:uncharacterized protein YgbK (DUF1537 family)